MKNYIQEGKALTWTNGTGSAVAAGSVVVMGRIIGVAAVDIADGASGAVAISGVFEVPKTTGAAWVQGASLIYDVSTSKLDVGTATPATGDVSVCCIAAAAAASADATGMALLNIGVGTVT